MNKESLDYLKLCPNYYTDWEDGCCMENCTFNDLDQCPIHYVKRLLAEKEEQLEYFAKRDEEQENNLKNKQSFVKNVLRSIKRNL